MGTRTDKDGHIQLHPAAPPGLAQPISHVTLSVLTTLQVDLRVIALLSTQAGAVPCSAVQETAVGDTGAPGGVRVYK